MGLVPRWHQKFPNLLGGKESGEGSNWGQFLQQIEEEFGALSSPHTKGLGISSDDKNVYIEAQVPGLNASDVDVSIDSEGVLWIKGEKVEEEKKERQYYKKAQTSFSYCIPLRNEVDTSQEPQAHFKNGVMKITFPKRKEKQGSAKKIKVEEEK